MGGDFRRLEIPQFSNAGRRLHAEWKNEGENFMKDPGRIRYFLVALLVSIAALAPVASYGGVFLSVNFAPPPLPVYAQPPCPGDGYLWNPGYWAYGPAGYYWVPGVWVMPPQVGLLWTPGFWGWSGGFYVWHAGYWGPHVGFYGGINYGFGYPGVGFVGGRWMGERFAYNAAVMNVNRTFIHNTYIDRTVIRNTYVNNRVSFNGPGGINARPTRAEQMATQRRFAPTGEQMAHERAAGFSRNNFSSVNGGRPAVAAMSRPMAWPGRGQASYGNAGRPQGRYNASRPAKKNQRSYNQGNYRRQPDQRGARPRF